MQLTSLSLAITRVIGSSRGAPVNFLTSTGDQFVTSDSNNFMVLS